MKNEEEQFTLLVIVKPSATTSLVFQELQVHMQRLLVVHLSHPCDLTCMSFFDAELSVTRGDL